MSSINKKYIKHLLKKISPVSYWYFLAGFIIFGTVFIFAYRQNNIGMIHLREAVFKADEQNGDVEKSLRELREYVFAHMNTNLASGTNAIKPPIQLKYQYERLVAQEKDRITTNNAVLAREAEAVCRQRFPVTANATGLQPCIMGYMAEKGVSEQPIPKEWYQFDFVSPRWSPDVAGWSLILSIIFGMLFVSRYSLELWLRRQLHEHA